LLGWCGGDRSAHSHNRIEKIIKQNLWLSIFLQYPSSLMYTWSKDETMSAEESKKYRCTGTRAPLTPQTNNVERNQSTTPHGANHPKGKETK